MQENVNRGVHLLNNWGEVPDNWPELINVDELEMHSVTRDILGQLWADRGFLPQALVKFFQDFSDTEDENFDSFNTELSYYGFTTPYPYGKNSDEITEDVKELTELWKEKIKELRNDL